MCGIFGYLSFDNFSLSEVNLNSMANSIEHRGPDATSIILKKEINTLIGFQRLESRDINFGSQPMEDEKNKIITANTMIFFNMFTILS